MDILSCTASSLNYILNQIAATVQLLFQLNTHCVSFILRLLTALSNGVVYACNAVWAVLYCCFADFVAFLDEFGLALYFTGQYFYGAVCKILSFVSSHLISCVNSICHAYFRVQAVIASAIKVLGFLIETFHYIITLFFSAVLLLLQGIPNGFILIGEALCYTVLGSANAAKAAVFSILYSISGLRNTLVDAILDIPPKAYIGLGILICIYYLKKCIASCLKSLFCIFAVVLLFAYIKLVDCIYLSAKKVSRVFLRMLRRDRYVINVTASTSRQYQIEERASFLSTLARFMRTRSLAAVNCDESSDNVQHLQRELSREKDRRLCIVCQDQERSVILLPCRHLCLCEECCLSLRQNFSGCPLCRKYILDTISVYT